VPTAARRARTDGSGCPTSSKGDGPQRRQEVGTFGTTTRELLRLADWLTAAGCTPGPLGECARRRLQTRLLPRSQYRRLVKRRGDKKAIVAVAHSILVIAYHLLRDGASYRELGGDYFDCLNADRLTRYHTKRLAALGYAVTLTKCAA
jgi:hypothetical protein